MADFVVRDWDEFFEAVEEVDVGDRIVWMIPPEHEYSFEQADKSEWSGCCC